MVVGGHLKGDGEAHDDDSNVEGGAVVGSEHGQEERANDAPGDAGGKKKYIASRNRDR